MRTKRFIGIFALVFIALISITSCAPSAGADPEGTADLTIVASIPDHASSRTIQPGTDSIVPDRIVVELSGSDEKIGDFTYEPEKESYTLNNVKVGSYTIKVTGYASYEIAEEKTDVQIMYGESSYTVTANGANSCKVKLEFGTDGTGAISAMITWSDLASGNSPVADAIRNGSIGFLAYYTKNNEPVIGEDKKDSDIDSIIHWVDDAEAGEYQYFEDKIPATGKVAEDIYFLIYTKDADGNISVVGKTFYSTLTVYSNIISIPDKNELYNFHLDSNNVQGYLLNVTDVNASHSETDPSGTLIVTWKNPDFSDNVYPMTVTVTLKEETEEANGYSAVNDVEFKTEASEGRTEFKGLDQNKTYSIYFKINGAIGYSLEELKIENARTQGVTAIAFKSGIAESYTVGDKVTVEATITPSAANQNAFSIVETNSNTGAVIDDEAHTITFNKHGDYSFKLVAKEKASVESDVMATTVKLNAPTNVKAEVKENVELTWGAVENAVSYKIYRNGSAEPIDTVSENKYTDTATIAGETYTYSVAASAGDAKYDSAAAASNEVTTEGAFISIELPKLPQDDITSYLEPVRGKYINPDDPDKEKNSFSIGLENPIEGATEYIWLLNDKEILRTKNYAEASVEISSSTNGFISDSDYNPNTLILRVETADGTCSGEVNFYVIKGELKTLESISDETGDNKVDYGKPEKLIPDFSEAGDITPVVAWTTSDEKIATVDAYGLVTVKSSGSVRITATVEATGESVYKDITAYVPVSGIEINAPDENVLIVEKAGVNVTNATYESVEYTIALTSAGADENVSSTKTIDDVVLSYDTSIVKIENGVITPLKAGETTIIASIDGVTDSINIIVHDFEIKFDGKISTGQRKVVTGGFFSSKTYPLEIIDNNSTDTTFNNATTIWCFGNEGDKTLNSKDTSFGSSGGIKVSIYGSGFNGTIDRQSNDEIHNAGVIIYLDSQEIAHVYFTAVALSYQL